MRADGARVLVIGSGAGGATTAHELAARGFDVLVVEEGRRFSLAEYGADSAEAMRRLYRRRGMTPILGRVPIGYVEGCAVGGSTEINSGFWHRTPPEVLLRWGRQYALAGAGPDELAPHFAWAEEKVGVGPYPAAWPASTQVFARGIEAMGWSGAEVHRAAKGCASTNACARGCPTGAKQGMSRNLVPGAEALGARVVTGCAVRMLLRRGRRVTGALAELRREDGSSELLRIDADHVFVCAGPTETPSLLRRSGIKRHVGDSLRIHPMLKVVAVFDDVVDAHRSVLPLLQVKEFWPDVSLGGAFFSPGHLAMLLGDNWSETRDRMPHYRRMASFYVGVRGTGRGMVRPTWFGDGGSTLRYTLSRDDVRHLSQGLARLSTLLLRAGAREVLPSVRGLPTIRSEGEAIRWLDEELPPAAMSLTTVHAFSACPIGERADSSAADSFGRVHGWDNLYVNDASMLPDSPGVNPQGTVMALARRNALRFAEAS